jgi:hypothetical protein
MYPDAVDGCGAGAPWPWSRWSHRPDGGESKTSETLVNFYQSTRRYNPEESHLRIHRRENVKYYLVKM